MIGGDPNGVPFHVFAHQEWLDRYGVKPPWGKVEYMKLATALKRLDTSEAARNAWIAYLADEDQYLTGHPPGLFLSQLSRWVVKAIKARPKPRKEPDFPGKARADAMVAIMREVELDPTIPQPMKRDEMARRWKQIPEYHEPRF